MPRPTLSNISTAALKNELERRTRNLDSLKAKRDALNKQIVELEGVTGKAPERTKPKRRRKPGRKPRAKQATGMPLAEYVRKALAKAPRGLRVTEIEKAVLAAGYPTKAKSVYKPVTKVLAKGDFKRLGRGIYGLKGVAKADKKVGKKVAKKAAPSAPKAKAPRKKRRTFRQTADQMILGLLKGGKSLTTAEIRDARKKQGRGGSADNALSKLVKDGKIKRKTIEGQRGSRYAIA
jgi:hypothetical protein